MIKKRKIEENCIENIKKIEKNYIIYKKKFYRKNKGYKYSKIYKVT